MKKIMIFLLILSFALSSCTKTIDVKEPCANFEGIEKDSCLHDLAVETEASLLDLCGKIDGAEERYGCYIDLLYKKSEMYNCQELFEDVAKIDECNLIQGANMKRVAMCDIIVNDDQRDECYRENVVFFDFSSEVCNKIQSETIKQECFDSINNRG